jgi:hypothetical protein
MSKIFRAKLALKEMSSQSIKLPANMQECDGFINGTSRELTGRTINITQSEPEYLSDEFEYKLVALQFGILMEDVSNDPKFQLTVSDSNVHNDLMPDISNKMTIADVDRFLFDHPLEPAIEAMLVKHGYIAKITLKDVGTVLDDSPGRLPDSPGQISLFSGAESLSSDTDSSHGFDDSKADKITSEPIVQNQFNPFKKLSVEA